jgi:hypothetical protein
VKSSNFITLLGENIFFAKLSKDHKITLLLKYLGWPWPIPRPRNFFSLKGHGNEPNFPSFLHKSLWPRSLALRFEPFDFGFEFAEIFVFGKRLPLSVSRGVDKIAYRYKYFQALK